MKADAARTPTDASFMLISEPSADPAFLREEYNRSVGGLEDGRDRALLAAVFNRLTLKQFRELVGELEHIEQAEQRHCARVMRFLHPRLAFADSAEHDCAGEDGAPHGWRKRREDALEKAGLPRKKAQSLVGRFAEADENVIECWEHHTGIRQEPWFHDPRNYDGKMNDEPELH